MNKFIGIGRLVKDAELVIKDTFQVAKFTMAIDRDYKKADGTKYTDFIQVEYFNKNLVNFTSYLKKGTLLAVEGALHINTIQNGDEYKTYTKINARVIELLSSNNKQQQEEDNSNIPF